MKNQNQNSALRNLFVNSLKDLYWAEQALVNTLPKMAEASTSDVLKEALEDHLDETKGHVKRLEQVFALLNEQPATKKCEAMSGLIKEGEDLLSETREKTEVRDVAIIFACQKIEHYEIASYGSLRTVAKTMGLDDAAELLQETLEEESDADESLTRIAESYVNEEASME